MQNCKQSITNSPPPPLHSHSQSTLRNGLFGLPRDRKLFVHELHSKSTASILSHREWWLDHRTVCGARAAASRSFDSGHVRSLWPVCANVSVRVTAGSPARLTGTRRSRSNGRGRTRGLYKCDVLTHLFDLMSTAPDPSRSAFRHNVIGPGRTRA